jgi:hypothetical protein
VLAKEVLRTDLYERRASEGSSREYVYVKYRCQRCKRMGEAFVPESRWDRSILEPAQNEMNDNERDQFLDEAPISDDEVLDFHKRLQALSDLNDLNGSPQKSTSAADAMADAMQEHKVPFAEATTTKADTNAPDTIPSSAALAGAAPEAAPQAPATQASGQAVAHAAKSNPAENTPPNQSSAGCPPEEPHSKVFRGDTQ